MNSSNQSFGPSDAAKRLGVSAKALRLYEQRGLITPVRTEAGWRTYGPEEMARASEIVTLRALGLSLGQVARVLDGDRHELEPALAAHQTALEGQIHQLGATVEKVRRLRSNMADGRSPAAQELVGLLEPASVPRVEFDLPWPWGGERFELSDIRPLNYIIGPLGSGKTRLAKRLAEALPDAGFLGLERLADDGAATRAQLAADPALNSRVEQILSWLIDEGATKSVALTALLAGLEAAGPAILVVDMLEQDLDRATQEAVSAYLRCRGPGGSPLSAILDLENVGRDEAIILCPANHSPPTLVAPYPGAPGYEAVATCLASPEVRARTEGVIAWRPKATG